MNQQTPMPPETWNDARMMLDSFRMWYGWHRLKDQRAAREPFRLGWKAGAQAASIAMWHWIQRVVFGHDEPEPVKVTYIENRDSVLDEKQRTALNMILETAERLTGAAGVAEESQNPDDIITHACIEGAKYLESVREYMEAGTVPAWYTDRAGDDQKGEQGE